ncbi:MAG: hypothetical protein NWQ54_21560 [Paraglaciecola sp.]|uniref:hypothetical protein n=1 Tax=Paraglaciecola sp. TaxID=1920173 RepID=UPI00273E1272|nr:hypothetical protein [Paraglaciecola sp.]MDP5032478.1 hypothetical protein [Paraglaciecola sp.]MDP5133478.1 hypothetical protein [Paraglaciecola sp.]
MKRKWFTHYVLITVLLLSQWLTVSAMACPLDVNTSSSTSMTAESPDMPCHEMPQSTAKNQNHSEADDECCASDCHCPSSACFTVLLLNCAHHKARKMSNTLLEHYQFSSLTTFIQQQQKPPQSI